MMTRTTRILYLALLLGILPASLASAEGLSLNVANVTAKQALALMDTLAQTSAMSAKQNVPYSRADDPAHKTSPEFSKPPEPQHGYFAVPLIVIGVAGILLYFCKFE